MFTQKPNKTGKCQKHLTTLSEVSAELHAILLAMDVVRRSKEKHFLLLSDSYSSLIALGGSHVTRIQFINI